ncbi:carbohydrate ABC transporter substrate-binding protein [Marinobacter halodurans]|uniref:Carbohydrate ABC transporter substrate-binding protein n=1 Tax=Marinobacter halodurans TaxID=2528979 RepID=A0ABY1ZMM3_9GAMM|nr:ABC transporter substrate-binding protein [Marinobacter halodurans]TBW57646.1 carbohydrate ABC transporter substrate-binding protein [Marinobacter halodurans]
MASKQVNRRAFLSMAASVVGLSCCPALRAGGIPLRFIWWGSAERADITRRAVSLFEANHPGVTVETDYLEWLDYWQHFVTLVAKSQTPDLIQMDYRYLALYARHGVLLPLDRYLGNQLNIASFGPHNIDACRVDGDLYGVNLGINSSAAILDTGAWADAGVEPPGFGTTWEAFAQKCEAFAKGNRRDNVYATPDASGSLAVFENWLRQKGKALYDADGQLAFTAADVSDWFEYWAGIRRVNGCVPADIQVLSKHSFQSSLLILGYTAMDYAHSNMFLNYQARMAQSLDLIPFPVFEGGAPGHYHKPSQMLSVGASSASPAIAVELANFLVMSPPAVRILGVDRGIPASPAMRQILLPQLDVAGRKTIAYIDRLDPFIGPLPDLPPPNAGEVAITFQSIGHEIAFRRLSPRQGGEQLFRQASAILAR